RADRRPTALRLLDPPGRDGRAEPGRARARTCDAVRRMGRGGGRGAVALARRGVLLVDDADGELAELRRRDERLAGLNWNLESAVYHFAARWRGVDLREDAADLPPPGADAVREFVDAFGMPPPAFRSRDGDRVELPAVERDGQLYDALMRRRTTRSFDSERPLSVGDLAVVLRYVFGYHGYARLFGEIT